MTDIELNFEKYTLPQDLIKDDILWNIKDIFIVPGNIHKTTTYSQLLYV